MRRCPPADRARRGCGGQYAETDTAHDMPRKRSYLKHAAAAARISSLVILLSACSKEPVLPPSVENTPPPRVPDAAEVTGAEYAATLPKVGGPHGYIGSAECRSCHEEQFSSWHRTFHRTMTQIAVGDAVQADFNGVVLTNETTQFTLSEKDGEHWVRMEQLAHVRQTGGEPEALNVRVGLVTGSHHMQVFWVPEGHGNLQIGFPFTWLIPEKRWVPRNSTFIRPPNLAHRSELWNLVCSRCHATGVEPHVDIANRRIGTEVGELGISCEACHGPGQRHVEARKLAAQLGGEAKMPPGEIVHPEKLTAERSSQVCGFCHSMKWIDESGGWREHGFTYRPGDDLELTTPIIKPSRTNDIEGLKVYLEKNPDLLDDFFWPDGMARVSGRDYNGLTESPCYKGGKFSCLSCHSMHDSEPDDQLAARAIAQGGNGACLQCHEKFKEPEALAGHTRHLAGSAGSECYNCHMPHTTYGVLKAIRSHQISSPRVKDDLAAGRPNACNLCHLDRTLAWTAGHLQNWFGQEIPALPPHATNLAHAVRLAITGDAGQRALAAWHLGWEPARRVSGTNWIAPVLGQMLEDPYAAVRLIAERSLRQTPGALPAGYDYALNPRLRTTVREEVWAAWEKQPGARAAMESGRRELMLSPKSLAERQRAFDELSWGRDDRPMRLRE